MVGQRQLILLLLLTIAMYVHTRPAMRIDIPTIMQELSEAREALNLQRYAYDNKLRKAKEVLRSQGRQYEHNPTSDTQTWPYGLLDNPRLSNRASGVMENFGRVI